jgi:hypothetical protein
MFKQETHHELSVKGGKASISSQFKGKTKEQISKMMRKRGKKGLLAMSKLKVNK